MKLEAGMYVRTKYGKIKKLAKYTVDENADYINNHRLYFEGDTFGTLHTKEELPKGSHNIIDLIEVGDYVNGHLVEDIKKVPNEEIDRVIVTTTAEGWDGETLEIYKEEIKSIVTKEQFSSMEYRLEGESNE